MRSWSFRTGLVRPTGVGTWTFALVPARIAREAGLRARMRVVGTIDRAPFRSSLMPRGSGAVFIVIPQALRDQIGKAAGQSVEVSLRPDTRPVLLRVPADFDHALGSGRPGFDRLAPSHRKAFLVWIAEAKQPATRQRRIAEAVRMVRRGLTRN